MTRLLINGYKGRMGNAIINCIPRVPGVEVAAKTDIGDSIEANISNCDVVIDFSHHSCTENLIDACVKNLKPVVIGTTGHTEDEKNIIKQGAQKIPVVWSSNFSTGVNTLFWVVRHVAEALGPEYDNEIIEFHHRLKKDAPSGTALSIAEILAEVKKRKLDEIARHGRHGETGVRTIDEIGIHAVRGGDVVGEHTVIFATFGERLEISHKASSRETFAMGAIRAAIWVVGRPPGIYSMLDVLGLK